MKVGIICAMKSELDLVEASDFGSRNEVRCVLSGLGKVNAAVAATQLVYEYSPDCVINAGVAGSLKSEIREGAVVVGAKTAYHDEPSFANTKIITSLFSDQLKGELGTNFKNCLEFREAKASILKDYNDKFDFLELGKLALDYSDGVIEATENINKELVDYANSKQIPYLKYQGADYMDAYSKFFNEISPEE